MTASSGGENTRAVHPPQPAPFTQRPLGLAVHRSSAFRFDDAQEYADLLEGDRSGYSYSRIANPTSDAFAHAIAALEGARLDDEVVAEPFGSGMGAILATLMAHTAAGAHVIAPAEIYGNTYSALTGLLARFGVESDFVDLRDLDAVRAATRPTTRIVYAESLANPTMTVADLPGLADVAHEAGALLVVDSTFASPAVVRPLEWGADVVVHSATKYIGGHSDVMGGVALGRPAVMAPVRSARMDLGSILSPDDAFLLHRGLSTLPLRVARHCTTALALAEAVSDHPRVERVYYPGLVSHRDHELAGKLFDSGPEGTRYGGVVSFTPTGDRAAGLALCDRLQLVAVATSLGGVHSVVSHVASTTHRQLDDAALAAAGIGPATVRVSVGLEDADDVIADVLAALDTTPQ